MKNGIRYNTKIIDVKVANKILLTSTMNGFEKIIGLEETDAGQDKMFVKVVEQVVEDTPIADVVEVVRCKDCKKWTSQHTCDEFTADRLPLRGKTTFITEPDDFCSYGQRKQKNDFKE